MLLNKIKSINSESTGQRFSCLLDALAFDLIRKQLDNVVLVNDESIFFKFYRNAFQITGVQFEIIDCEQINDLMTLESYLHKTVFFPTFGIRIFNINFDQIEKIDLGVPYFVHITTNHSQIIEQTLKSKTAHVITEPTLIFPHFFKTYLESAELMNWLHLTQSAGFHNDQIDRSIILKELSPSNEDPYHRVKIMQGENLLMWCSAIFSKEESVIQHRHYPVHRIYELSLSKNLPINLNERQFYGDVVQSVDR
ncbi:MAG: hypothetical protein A2622_14200 [Bdellovibrionales bacterium RIFCSPHIGHO2_01_FULL_40_29]|nr:MAG: hypothetical protein A2622_14200 [Bdellovibrionales bacterium RIFCSPHIGHO2_01_FULL_40_29]OFZ33673.1 MAG: hypothetical protein A3D17_11810 [Bdellovibrionales bacterium RIFCSPHIGHO2_02_FULL_40_15]